MVALRYSTLIVLIFVMSIAFAIDDAGIATVGRAVSHLSNGDYKKAAVVLESVDAKYQDEPFVTVVRDMSLLCDGNAAEAMKGFKSALQKDDKCVPALWGLTISLLSKNNASEALPVIEKAVKLSPQNAQLRVLQAYTSLMLGQKDEAKTAAQTAEERGSTSPMLYAILAEIMNREGENRKAVEYGRKAAKPFIGMNYLNEDIRLPLPLTGETSGQAFTRFNKTTTRDIFSSRLPIETIPEERKTLTIVMPNYSQQITGIQTIQILYKSTRVPAYFTFYVDDVLRGYITSSPYQFNWNADMALAGKHELVVKAMDISEKVIAQDKIVIDTTRQLQDKNEERIDKINNDMMMATVPTPAPASFYALMGQWYRDAGHHEGALAAYEKAAAIDPACDHVIDKLAELYRINGLHNLAYSGEIFKGPATGKKLVALTFDDGPNTYTPIVLADLQRYNDRATFFVVGKKCQENPDMLKDILAQGHELANHTYTHPNLTKLDMTGVIAEILRDRRAIQEITGVNTYLCRPPGGQIDAAVVKQLRKLDYNIIYWDINAGDYKKMAPAEQTAKILSRMEDGSIILLHSGPVDGTTNILSKLLQGISEKGFTCVTVTELMNSK
ncbi:MAG: polysaccharide deacetylase family protein [bacterium]